MKTAPCKGFFPMTAPMTQKRAGVPLPQPLPPREKKALKKETDQNISHFERKASSNFILFVQSEIHKNATSVAGMIFHNIQYCNYNIPPLTSLSRTTVRYSRAMYAWPDCLQAPFFRTLLGPFRGLHRTVLHQPSICAHAHQICSQAVCTVASQEHTTVLGVRNPVGTMQCLGHDKVYYTTTGRIPNHCDSSQQLRGCISWQVVPETKYFSIC